METAPLDISPDGRMLATGSWDTTAVLVNIKTGKRLKTFKGHGCKGIWSVAFSPDGYYIATGSTDTHNGTYLTCPAYAIEG